MKAKYVQPKIKPTRHSQMFWAGFSYQRRTSLYPLMGDPEAKSGGVTGRRIQECLEDQLPTILAPNLIFAQDNAPTHTAKIVQKWLKDWAEIYGLQLVDWPAYSPDLNPIENLWKLLKERINNEFPELALMPKNNSTLQRLCEAAISVWEDIDNSLLTRLIDSIPNRIKAVINIQGWYTKY